MRRWKGKFYNRLKEDLYKEYSSPVKGKRRPLNLYRTLELIREGDEKLCQDQK